MHLCNAYRACYLSLVSILERMHCCFLMGVFFYHNHGGFLAELMSFLPAAFFTIVFLFIYVLLNFG